MSSVTQAAASGDERSLLFALEAVLAEAIDRVGDPRDIAPLVRELLGVLRALAALRDEPGVFFDPNDF